jgi:cell wall-associated NlpC family hydrolase
MRCNYLFFSVLIICGCASPPPPSPRSPEAAFQALAAAGVPYRRGGASPETGFDCSGLVAHVYREAYGIQLPHNALAQSRMGRHVTLTGLAAGDLVFYNTERRPYSHVGIYLGDHRFIHAPKPGTAVRIEDMRTAYWSRRFDGARRVLEE